MHQFAIRIDPRALSNPDTDLRVALPDLLVKRSAGLIRDEGWGYFSEEVTYMVFILTTYDLPRALTIVAEVLETEEVLGNRLACAAAVAVKEGSRYRVISPSDFVGDFETGEDDDQKPNHAPEPTAPSGRGSS